jgi:hypothetical protein
MTAAYVKNYAARTASQHPHLMGDIMELYELFLDETGDGNASIAHEGELCCASIKELLNENL